MNREQACPPARDWHDLLAGNVPEHRQSLLFAHLEGCAICRRELELCAGADDSWDQVAQRLASLETSAPQTIAALAAAMSKLKTHAHDGEVRRETLVSPDLPPGVFGPPAQPGHLGTLDHYQILSELGRGAMGIVFKAYDPNLHRVVAIKIMSPQLAAVPLARQRFLREGHSIAAVCHEHVVAIHAIGEVARLPYLVMQFVAGKTLQQRLEQGGPMSTSDILRIGMQAAAGLAAAHAQGIVHRDIKPANLLLENGIERVKLTDFGLARAVDDASLTQAGVITGTPQFMAPEQARGETVDARADLFSLGCVLYYMSTGRPPFVGSSVPAVLRHVCETAPRPIRDLNPEIPAWFAGIVDKLLAKQPHERFGSAAGLADLLAQCLTHWRQPNAHALPSAAAALATPTGTPAARRPAPPWYKTPRRIVILVAAAIVPFLLALANKQIDRWWGPQATREDGKGEQASSAPVSEAEIAELARLESIAQEQLRTARIRTERGISPIAEVLEAEAAYLESRIRRAQAVRETKDLPQWFDRIIAIRETQVEHVKPLVESGHQPPVMLLKAEETLSQARLARARLRLTP